MIIRSYFDTEKSKLTNSISPSCCYYCCVRCGKDKLFSCFLFVCCLILILGLVNAKKKNFCILNLKCIELNLHFDIFFSFDVLHTCLILTFSQYTHCRNHFRGHKNSFQRVPSKSSKYATNISSYTTQSKNSIKFEYVISRDQHNGQICSKTGTKNLIDLFFLTFPRLILRL